MSSTISSFRPVAGHPRYEINREGMIKRRVRGPSTFIGRILGNHKGRVHIDKGWHDVADLVRATWGTDVPAIAPKAEVKTIARKVDSSLLSAFRLIEAPQTFNDELRAFQPSDTPILSHRPWIVTGARQFHWLSDAKPENGRRIIQTNQMQLTTAKYANYRMGDRDARTEAMAGIKAEIESIILGDQAPGLVDGRRLTGSARALGFTLPSQFRISFNRPPTETPLANNETMITVEWALMPIDARVLTDDPYGLGGGA